MKNQKLFPLLFTLLVVGNLHAQGVQDVFVNASTKDRLEQNAAPLSQHLAARRTALEAWNALPASELQPVTLTAFATAKNRGGFRELRIREFHYIGDCGQSHGGQDSGVDTPTTAQAVFASDLVNSFLNEAALAGVDIRSIEIEIHARPDEKPTGRVWYPRNFLYTYYIDSPASDEVLEQLAVRAEEKSPVATFVKQAYTVPHTVDIRQSPRERVVEGSTLAGLREYIHGKRQAILARKGDLEKIKKDPKAQNQLLSVKEGPHVRVFADGTRQLTVNEKYLILHDNPKYLGGNNLGMTSIENLLGVLGTCVAHIAEGQAAELNLDVDSLQLEIQAEWDPRAGRPGFENVPLYPQNIRYILHTLTPESPETVNLWIEKVENICPIFNLFKDTQTFEHRIVRK